MREVDDTEVIVLYPKVLRENHMHSNCSAENVLTMELHVVQIISIANLSFAFTLKSTLSIKLQKFTLQ